MEQIKEPNTVEELASSVWEIEIDCYNGQWTAMPFKIPRGAFVDIDKIILNVIGQL